MAGEGLSRRRTRRTNRWRRAQLRGRLVTYWQKRYCRSPQRRKAKMVHRSRMLSSGVLTPAPSAAFTPATEVASASPVHSSDGGAAEGVRRAGGSSLRPLGIAELDAWLELAGSAGSSGANRVATAVGCSAGAAGASSSGRCVSSSTSEEELRSLPIHGLPPVTLAAGAWKVGGKILLLVAAGSYNSNKQPTGGSFVLG